MSIKYILKVNYINFHMEYILLGCAPQQWGEMSLMEREGDRDEAPLCTVFLVFTF